MKVDEALSIARVALRFGKVERATEHPDGSPESDATHTVMLMLVVAELAREERLDVGLAVQFAAVHDLVETYAGDTCTARGLSPEEREAKNERESASLERLRVELGEASWAVQMIDRYEAQLEPEARLVRHVDKIMPKLTHVLNGGSALRRIGMTYDEVERKHTEQGEQLASMYSFQHVEKLFEACCWRAEKVLRETLAASDQQDPREVPLTGTEVG